jgi:hypothetical protein
MAETSLGIIESLVSLDSEFASRLMSNSREFQNRDACLDDVVGAAGECKDGSP